MDENRTLQPGNGSGVALWEAIRTSLTEVWTHKLRSLLTLVGVILGTMAVVLMVTLIDGIKVMVWDGFYSLGYDGVMFVSYRPPDDPTERDLRADRDPRGGV